MSDVRTILERGVGDASPPPDPFGRMLRRHDRKRRNRRITARVVGIAVFVAAVWIVRDVSSLNRTHTHVVPGGSGATGPAGTGPTVTGPTVTGTTVNPAGDFFGLPPEGAEPSGPEHGELVAGVDQLHVGWAYVYADGRVISFSEMGSGSGPVPLGPEPAGYREQRLTVEGVDLLLSRLHSTGLFDRDLDIDTGSVFTQAPLFAFVRDGDRFVHVRDNLDDAPPPTTDQASALELVARLLTDPGSLVPPSAWADPTLRPYVPYRYAICQDYGTLHSLPSAAADLLLGRERSFDLGEWTGPWGGNASWDCYDVTIEEARALDGILTDAGFTGAGADLSTTGETFQLVSPERSTDLEPLALVSFYPVFPHGSFTAHPLG